MTWGHVSLDPSGCIVCFFFLRPQSSTNFTPLPCPSELHAKEGNSRTEALFAPLHFILHDTSLTFDVEFFFFFVRSFPSSLGTHGTDQ